jgi:hypothetical protein
MKSKANPRKIDPILKKPNTNSAGGVAQGIGPEFKCQYRKKGRMEGRKE